jgi:hypothetical protein
MKKKIVFNRVIPILVALVVLLTNVGAVFAANHRSGIIDEFWEAPNGQMYRVCLDINNGKQFVITDSGSYEHYISSAEAYIYNVFEGYLLGKLGDALLSLSKLIGLRSDIIGAIISPLFPTIQEGDLNVTDWQFRYYIKDDKFVYYANTWTYRNGDMIDDAHFDDYWYSGSDVYRGLVEEYGW